MTPQEEPYMKHREKQGNVLALAMLGAGAAFFA